MNKKLNNYSINRNILTYNTIKNNQKNNTYNSNK